VWVPTKPVEQTQAPASPPAPAPLPAPAPGPRVEVAPLPRVETAPLPVPPSQSAALPPPTVSVSPPPRNSGPKEEVRAALLVPLSGPSAALGAMLSNAAQLALFEVADTHFNLIPLDTRGTPEGAAAAARLALNQGADIVLGPLSSAEVMAAAPVVRDQGVPMVAFTTTKAALGNGVYSTGFLPGSQVRRVVAQARADGRQRFAVLAPDNAYGRAMVEEYKAAVVESGAAMGRIEYYDPAVADPTPVAKRFADYERRRGELEREKKALAGRGGSQAMLAELEKAAAGRTLAFDAVLLPDEGVRLKSVASLITYYGIDPGPVRLLGTMAWDDPRLVDEPSLQGGWFPAPPEAAHAAFEARYVKAFGPLPPRMGNFASAAYDSAALAATLARQGQGDFPPSALTNPGGFTGIDGIFRLRPDGTSERALAVREMVRGGAHEIGPAPTSFDAPAALPPVGR